MGLSNKNKYVLFALYKYLLEANLQFADKPLSLSVSKSVFIDLVKSAKIIEKSTRALYKNLEVLEKKKLIAYKNKFLIPTSRGLKYFHNMNKAINPYVHLSEVIKGDIAKCGRRVQTFFK